MKSYVMLWTGRLTIVKMALFLVAATQSYIWGMSHARVSYTVASGRRLLMI